MKTILHLFLIFSLLMIVSCSDDKDGDKDCGKDIYDPMEHNPAKEVQWIVDMIKEKGSKSGYFTLYKMNGENYYMSSFSPLSDEWREKKREKSTNMDQAPYFIYNSEGEFCAVSHYIEYWDFLEIFHKEAAFVAAIWEKKSCEKFDPNRYD